MSGRDTAIERAMILRGALLEHGVPEVSIEVQDGRPASGDTWNACKPVGVISHHIASTPTVANPTPGLSLVKRGRSDLPGPLCNGTAGVDLVYRIICLGYANHPGVGGPLRLTGPMGSYTIPEDVGRPYLWGTEYEGGFTDAVWDATYTNRRTKTSMTFREFMGRSNAGLTYGIWLINGLGKTPAKGVDLSGYHGEHATWTSRKIDRRNYSTERGRAEARPFYTTTLPEDDMPTPEDLWNYKITPNGPDKPKAIPAKVMLAQTHRRSEVAKDYAIAAFQQGKRNRAAIAALADGMPDDVAAKVVAALGDEQREPDKSSE